MQDNNALAQAQVQPFMKLVQSNMQLIAQFSNSQEVAAQTTSNATAFFQQASESASKLMRSGAFAEMTQGMLRNYTEFLSELGQSGMNLFSQGHAAFLRQTQEAAGSVVDVTDARARRSRSQA
jgi:hypothetical protein